MTHSFIHSEPFLHSSGRYIKNLHLTYTTHGSINEAQDNVVWIFHALTANSDPLEWWPGLVGAGRFFDPQNYFIICVNKPGSNYGSISPNSINPDTNKPYGNKFPFFTIRDIIKSYQVLKNALGIKRIFAGLGGSTGGMQLLEWAIMEPSLFQNIIPIATAAVLSPWGVAFNASQRMAIEADNTWLTEQEGAATQGLAAARSIALLSYRSYSGYDIAQPRDKCFTTLSNEAFYAADNYQRYQGGKFTTRFDAICYYKLTQTMDSHNVGKDRGGLELALGKIKSNTFIIGITSDLLFPIAELEFLHTHISGAELLTINSDFGHDGFLLEYEKIENGLKRFLRK